MTTELVLLISIFVFLVARAFFGDHGPLKTFESSGPRLGARIEQQLSTGRDFKNVFGQRQQWEKPSAGAPDGKFLQ
ncbi:MAG: hypothetical protein V4760_01975 [Bdellovibrionota bacterium]